MKTLRYLLLLLSISYLSVLSSCQDPGADMLESGAQGEQSDATEEGQGEEIDPR